MQIITTLFTDTRSGSEERQRIRLEECQSAQ